jgi:Double zinc ribbon
MGGVTREFLDRARVMWHCPSCGAAVDDGSERCWGCGWRHAPDVPADPPYRFKDEDQITRPSARPPGVGPWTCPKCAAVVDPGFAVCWNCGTTSDGVEDPHFVREEDVVAIDDEPEDPGGVTDAELDARDASPRRAPPPERRVVCHRCGGEMVVGHLVFPFRPAWFTLLWGHESGAWIAGRSRVQSRSGTWLGGEHYPLLSYRCEDCGLVELYARP